MGDSPTNQLGRYQIVKHLASGGMAEVLLARATGIEDFTRHVVIKRIHAERAKDPEFVRMFLDEARLAASLHHHNIVQVHDIGQNGGEYFFAMEYVHGEDLRHVLTEVNKRREKVPIEHVVTIILAAAAGLHYAHEMRGPDRKPLGLVHRDVSPANIIVGFDGHVKVVDFGIAKAATTRTVEAGGVLKGKVSYMSPEQCSGKPADRRSDVFALGIVMYELTTVRRLFKAPSDFLTMSAITQGQIPKPSQRRPDLAPELEAIIMKALAVDPADRFQTAEEMREALEAYAAKTGLRTSTAALVGYMKALFGDKPEPWLVEDDDDLELSVDFDGSVSGLVAPPPEALESFVLPPQVAQDEGAPIVRARTRAITEAPLVPEAPNAGSTPALPLAAAAAGEPSATVAKPVRRGTPAPIAGLTEIAADPAPVPPPPDAAWDKAAATGTGAPLLWPTGTSTDTPSVRSAFAAKRLRILLAAGVAALAIIIIAIVAFGGDDAPDGRAAVPRSSPPAGAIAPSATQELAPAAPQPASAQPQPAPPIPAAATELPAGEPAPDRTASGSAHDGSAPAVTPPASKTTAPTKPTTRSSTKQGKKPSRPRGPAWNPNELFPQ